MVSPMKAAEAQGGEAGRPESPPRSLSLVVAHWRLLALAAGGAE